MSVSGHGVGLGDDDHQVGGVEALEVVRGAGGESNGEGLVVDLVPGGPEDAAPQAVLRRGRGRS